MTFIDVYFVFDIITQAEQIEILFSSFYKREDMPSYLKEAYKILKD